LHDLLRRLDQKDQLAKQHDVHPRTSKKERRTRPCPPARIADGIAELQGRWLGVPIVFADRIGTGAPELQAAPDAPAPSTGEVPAAPTAAPSPTRADSTRTLKAWRVASTP
jgi:hypothetical protein